MRLRLVVLGLLILCFWYSAAAANDCSWSFIDHTSTACSCMSAAVTALESSVPPTGGCGCKVTVEVTITCTCSCTYFEQNGQYTPFVKKNKRSYLSDCPGARNVEWSQPSGCVFFAIGGICEGQCL